MFYFLALKNIPKGIPAVPTIHTIRINKITPNIFCIQGKNTPVIVPKLAPLVCVLLAVCESCCLTEPILPSLPSLNAVSATISSCLS